MRIVFNWDGVFSVSGNSVRQEAQWHVAMTICVQLTLE